jgi:6-phosphogluconolactonase (cycloisomerase 2 family)
MIKGIVNGAFIAIGIFCSTGFSQGLDPVYLGSIVEKESSNPDIYYNQTSEISRDGRFLYVGSQRDSSLCWYQRDSLTGNLTYSGNIRQGSNGLPAHVRLNLLYFDPSRHHLYVTSGQDTLIFWFNQDSISGVLTYGGVFKPPKFCYSFVFSGLFVYAVLNSDSAIICMNRDTVTGALTMGSVKRHAFGQIDGLGKNMTRLVSSPDNRFLYLGFSARSISTFSINSSDGSLQFDASLTIPTPPTSMGVSPDGHFLYSAGLGNSGGSLARFSRIAATGAISYIGEDINANINIP